MSKTFKQDFNKTINIYELFHSYVITLKLSYTNTFNDNIVLSCLDASPESLSTY